jgi:hypothetical protein
MFYFYFKNFIFFIVFGAAFFEKGAFFAPLSPIF